MRYHIDRSSTCVVKKSVAKLAKREEENNIN